MAKHLTINENNAYEARSCILLDRELSMLRTVKFRLKLASNLKGILHLKSSSAI